MVWIIVLLLAIGLIKITRDFGNNEKLFHAEHKISIHNLLDSGTYVSGHPNLNDPLKSTKMQLAENDVKIFTAFQHRASIPKNLITNVTLEDSSTVQSRVGIRRLLMVGIFAFAWKKKEKLESAYLVIEWNQGNFKNETIFEFEGDGAISRANTLRNKLITYLS